MVLVKGNKRSLGRPLEKVSITSYDTSQTTMGERDTYTHAHMHTCTHTYTEKKKILSNIIYGTNDL
jgi:hypothetical protein